MLVIPLLLVVIVWYLIILLKWKKNVFDFIEKVPGLRWYPFTGTFYPYHHASREEVFYKFAEVTTKYAPFYRSWHGHIPEVHLMKADYLQIVMRSSTHSTKGSLYSNLLPWLGEGLFISEGAKWFLQRKLLTPTFHFKVLEHFVHSFVKNGNNLLKRIEGKADGNYFDITQDVSICTLEVICDTAMGIPMKDIGLDPLQFIRNTHELSELVMWKYWMSYLKEPFVHLHPKGRRYNNLLKMINAFSDKVVAIKKTQRNRSNLTANELNTDGENCKKKRTSFLDLVMEAKENEYGISDSDLRALVNTFLFAGYDTTSGMIGWTLFMLGNYPEIQEKAYEEVQRVLKGKGVPTSMDQIQELRYLDCIVKETLRLFPILPIITRRLSEDIKIDKYDIPAGTQAILHIFGTQRDPEHYTDPNAFNPDRFLPENSKGRHPFAFVPFSAGPRICLGIRFSYLEMKSVLAMIIHKFKIASMNTPENIKLFVHVLLRSQNGIQVKLEKREEIAQRN